MPRRCEPCGIKFEMRAGDDLSLDEIGSDCDIPCPLCGGETEWTDEELEDLSTEQEEV